LRTLGALEDKETGRPRPIAISVNAGIHIKGNKNTVCGRKKLESHQTAGIPEASDWPAGSKRRACSEPVDVPRAKRSLLGTALLSRP